VTVLSLVIPLLCGAMFAQIDAGQSRAIQPANATKVALAVVAALMGARVLQVFGISLQSFSIASGGVVELDRVYHDARSITAAAAAL
jgi:multiple antibiotic resistance protein